MEEFSFVPCVFVTFLVATLLQATYIWQLIVIAGVVAGFLAKDFKTAIPSGVLGLLASWLLYFALLGLGAPVNFGLVFSFFSMFFVIGILLIIVLGLASASFGYFFWRVVEEARSKDKKKKK